MIDERLERIAEKHGLEAQRDKAVEELAELIRALVRYRPGCTIDDRDNLIEELADAKIMIDQVIHLTNTEIDVSEIVEQKIRRQMNRDRLE